ncbi:hypothetical protein AC578_7792 [Pseudocercospora eumusae]|uniref:H/ACA ribonucleoprotein complex subunit 2 n=1 Tax=Pseudocercospora eumusae TaxID=321146 RepID=A0A139GW43_9PEZI|nr:hypothetical protein AC578_7792 [Pseudocercospora eumusae]
MAKTEAEIAAKKEKKDKKRKAEDAEVESAPKKAKKEKAHKRESLPAPVEADSVMDVDGQTLVKVEDANEDGDKKAITGISVAALVPFANPLADDKSQKKVLKSVKKAAKHKALKRGVKECVKSIRKSPPATPASLGSGVLPNGIVILAADISPMDVISHIPVLCEDHNIPYIYVPSRAELGAAGSTKRPTSVVMLTPNAGGKKDGKKDEDAGEWDEAYKELHKLALKLGQHVKV